MDKLGLDIICLIADELSRVPDDFPYLVDDKPPELAGYSTISRSWQFAIERRTFVKVKFSSDSLERFVTIFSRSASRRTHVRHIEFNICLPTKGITEPDFQQDHNHFIDSVHSFLSELSKWEVGVPDNALPPLKLRWTCSSGDTGDYPDLQYRFPAIYDEEFQKLPTVRRITSLSTEPVAEPLTHLRLERWRSPNAGRAMHPKAICQLASLMPRLDTLDIRYLDPGHLVRDRRLRVEHRNALADGLLGLGKTLKEWRKLVLSREGCDDPRNHSFQCPDLEDEHGVDKLCDSIRQVLQAGSLEELDMAYILLSSALFRDPDLDTVVTWPSIRRIEILTGMMAPSGRWYFTGSPQEQEADWRSFPTGDEDDEEEEDEDETGQAYGTRRLHVNHPKHFWRNQLDPEIFDPFVKDLSEAVLRMLELQSAWFRIDVNDIQWNGVDIRWDRAGTLMALIRVTEEEKANRHKWIVRIEPGQNWAPPEAVLASWEEWGCGLLQNIE